MLAWLVSVALLSAASAELAASCPDSPAWLHASCSVEVATKQPCSEVLEEIHRRVAGQREGTWRDPHNNGTYREVSQEQGLVEFTRTSGTASVGGRQYTDRVRFVYEQPPGGGCHLVGCSVSQVMSIADFSTNYCNMRNLYCNAADGCSPLASDLQYKELKVSPSLGAGSDAASCVVEAEASEARSVEEGRRLAASPGLPEAEDLGGFYVDPNHYRKGTFAGARVLSMRQGDKASAELTLVGSDDGKAFWTLHGQLTSAQGDFVIDFSPKGGPKDLRGAYSRGRLTFSDGNAWSRLGAPDCPGIASSPGAHFDGFYADPNHYKRGSFAGTRMVSNRQGDKPTDSITLVGTDDGLLFWTLHGRFTHKAAGSLVIDFSPKGGPANLEAQFGGSRITYGDGNFWSQQEVQDCAPDRDLFA